MPSTDVLIVNWNAGEQLIACVDSLLAHEAAEVAQVVIVDNASSDGSIDRVEPGDVVRVIRSSENLGFGAACNLAARLGSARYILLLNPDTRLLDPALRTAREFLDSDEGQRFGICGAQHVDENGHVARHCARFPSMATFMGELSGLSRLFLRAFPPLRLTEFDHLSSRPVDHVMGAFYLIRRDLFEQLGGFDDRFFVYLEDLDLSLRAAQAAAPTYYLAEARIFHHGGGTSRQIKARALFYALQARLLYCFKHFSAAAAIVILLATLLIDPITRVIYALAGRSPADAGNALRAHAMLWRNLPGILRRAHLRQA